MKLVHYFHPRSCRPPVEAPCLSSQVVPCPPLEFGAPDHGELSSFSAPDWRRLQLEDHIIGAVFDILGKQEGDADNQDYQLQFPQEVACLLRKKNCLTIREGIMYRRRLINGEEKLQLIVPDALGIQALCGLDDDVGHLGRDRTRDLSTGLIWLRKRRSTWETVSAVLSVSQATLPQHH